MRRLIFLITIVSFLSCSKDSTNQEGQVSEIKYSIEIIAGEGGTVDNNGGSYSSGTQLSILATPNNGYRFKEWSNGQTDNPLTITVSGNLNITAVFEPFSVVSFIDLGGTKLLQIRNAVISGNSVTVLFTYHKEGLGVLEELDSNTSRENNAALINLDFNGKVNWIKLIDTDYLYASPHNLIINDTGNFIVSGYLTPSDAPSLNDNQEFFILETTTNGNQNWINRVATNENNTKIQHSLNRLMSYKSSSNQSVSYSAAVYTDAQGGIFENTTTNPIEPYYLINLDNNGGVVNTIKLNNREVDDFRINVEGVTALKGSNQGKFLVYGDGIKSNSDPYRAVSIAIYDEEFNEIERRWIEPFNTSITFSKIIPLDDGGFLHLIPLDMNDTYRKIIRKYNSDFELVWEREELDEYAYGDFQIDGEHIYISGYLYDSYFLSKKMKINDGTEVWEFKQNISQRKTIVYHNLLTEDEVILVGTAQDYTGFFADNPSNSTNEPNLMLIRLDKETGNLKE